jgi:hypothetical protein
MEGTRRCSACGITKSLESFWKRRDTQGRFRLWRSKCKTCAGPQNRAASRALDARHPQLKMLRNARLRASVAGVPFEIDVDDIEIPHTCPVLGLPLILHHGRKGPRDSSPTLDRIVPSLGYVRGNIIVVSWRANRLKSDATMDELARIVAWYRALGVGGTVIAAVNGAAAPIHDLGH